MKTLAPRVKPARTRLRNKPLTKYSGRLTSRPTISMNRATVGYRRAGRPAFARAVGPRTGPDRRYGSPADGSALLFPYDGKGLAQRLELEPGWLPAVEDHLDDVGSKQREPQNVPDIGGNWRAANARSSVSR